MKLTEKLLNLIYPPSLYCASCGKIINATRTYSLCNTCMDQMKWTLGRTCLKCGKPLADHNPREICFSRSENPHHYDHGCCCTEYGSVERALIFGLKYNSKTENADIIAEIMYDRLVSLGSPVYDFLVPVPMFTAKRLSRGYNQAALIASRLSRLTLIPSPAGILVREKETRALRGLSPAERRVELRGVFGRGERSCLVQGKDVLLIDDIYTTGATVDECARVLRECGAARIDFMSFASGADVVK